MVEVAHDRIPEAAFERFQDKINLGTLFEKLEDGTAKLFDSSAKDRHLTELKYRIPEHQRFPSWSMEKKVKLIDSVFRNYPLQGFTVSNHHEKKDGDGVEVYHDIEDGQSRLSILQAYFNDMFTFCDKKFSELPPATQRRFENYWISVEYIQNGSQEDIHESFQRLQEGNPLRDVDKFWNQKNSPLVDYAISLLGQDYWQTELWNTPSGGFTQQKRQKLDHICGIVTTLMQNDILYCTSSFRIHSPVIRLCGEVCLETQQKIKDFVEFYQNLWRRVYTELPLQKPVLDKNGRWKKNTHGDYSKEQQLPIWKITLYLGMILADWIEETGESPIQKQQRWVSVINIARRSPNFIGGKQTFWHGLGIAVDVPASGPASLRLRVSRVREFTGKSQSEKMEYCQANNIDWLPTPPSDEE